MSATILILGGTAQARELAHALAEKRPDLNLLSAIAGLTRSPPKIPGQLFVGALGGAPGLADFIRRHDIQMLIDATHPFAATISQNAVHACDATATQRLRLDRPAWVLPRTANIRRVADFTAAADLVAGTSNSTFLAIGHKNLGAFRAVQGVHFLVRLLDPETADAVTGPLKNCTVICARPPFRQADEEALLRHHDIDTLVSKDSGGTATRAKIDAALKLDLRIVLVRRPPPPPGDTVNSIEAALKWLDEKPFSAP